VPYIVRWPGRIASGAVTAQQALTMDWDRDHARGGARGPHPDYPLDGVSPVPVLEDPRATITRDLYWRMKFRSQKALRSGDWKYLALDGDEFLFDLAQDQRERANLAPCHPPRAWRASRALRRLGSDPAAPFRRTPTVSIPYTQGGPRPARPRRYRSASASLTPSAPNAAAKLRRIQS
jgi:arylsulfatase A-like enzyme